MKFHCPRYSEISLRHIWLVAAAVVIFLAAAGVGAYIGLRHREGPELWQVSGQITDISRGPGGGDAVGGKVIFESSKRTSVWMGDCPLPQRRPVELQAAFESDERLLSVYTIALYKA